MWGFGKKLEKILNSEKLKNFADEGMIFEKKTFSLF